MKKIEPKAQSKLPSKIVVVDDHPIVRHGIVQLLNFEKDFRVCGEAENAVAALEIIEKTKPDAVTVDITLQEGMNGVELIKHLHKRNPKLPILVLSMHEEQFYAERALRAGAKGYLMKQEASEKMVSALRKILKGEIYLSESMSLNLLSEMLEGKSAGKKPVIHSLTDRELEIFNQIGRGFSAKKIASELNLSVKTVEAHRENIKAKLKLSTSSALMAYAIKWIQK
jgi:DNA-binding NarL/FixJ family response regulator